MPTHSRIILKKTPVPPQILARLWRHSSGGAIHKLATCSRLPPPDAAPGPHVIVAAGRNEAAIWDLSKGGACKQVQQYHAQRRSEQRRCFCCILSLDVESHSIVRGEGGENEDEYLLFATGRNEDKRIQTLCFSIVCELGWLDGW